MLWDIIYYLLVLLPIGTLILNYINYKFKNRLINVLTILSVTFGLYWFPFGINEFKYLEFMTYFCGDDDGFLVFFIAFSIMTIIDIFIIGRTYKDNKKVSKISKILSILSIVMLILMLTPFYSDYDVTTNMFCKILTNIMAYYFLFLTDLFFIKSALTVLLFTFLLFKTIVLLIHKIKDRIKQ